MPTFNRSIRFDRAINSVLMQDYSHLEIVISDNASTDGTEDYCRELASRDNRVRYIRQSRNLGPTHNFRTVLDESHGEFFMWVADDDWLEDTGFIRRCIEELYAHPDYALVGGTIRYHRDYDDGLPYLAPGFNVLQVTASERVRSYFAQVRDNGIFYGIMRRKVMIRIQLKNGLGGDWIIVAALAFVGKIRMLEDISINRSLRRRNMEALVNTLELPRFYAWIPMTIIAISAFIDIVWTSETYRTLNLLSRIKLGMQCGRVIIRKRKRPYIITLLVTRFRMILPSRCRELFKRIRQLT